MAQRRRSHRLDIVETYVEAALHQSAHFAAENERLAAARTAAEAEELVRNGNGGVGLGVGGEDQTNSVVLHMRSHGHLANELLQFHQRRTVEDLVRLGPGAFGSTGEDFGQLGCAWVSDQEFEEE